MDLYDRLIVCSKKYKFRNKPPKNLRNFPPENDLSFFVPMFFLDFATIRFFFQWNYLFAGSLLVFILLLLVLLFLFAS